MKGKTDIEFEEIDEEELEEKEEENEALEEKAEALSKELSSLPPLIARESHVKTVEAALFLANKPMTVQELSAIAKSDEDSIRIALKKLAQIYEEAGSAIEVSLINDIATMQVKPQFLPHVNKLSKEIEISKKALKILALIAKKKEILQKELKYYFKGEIYAYITELKNLGYIAAERHRNTRKLKLTKKFFECFQAENL